MGKLQSHLFKMLNQDQLFSLCLILTMIFFIYKGVLYALIGSYVPFLFIFTILGLMSFTFNKSSKVFRKIVGLWSVLIILWSAIRLLLSMVNQFVKPIPEGHVDGQLGLISTLLSMIFLCAGIYMWKNRRILILETESAY